MNEQLKLLIDLQKLDSIILSSRATIDTIPARISSEEGPFKKAQAAYENVKQRHEILEKKKKEKEIEIEDFNERIKKLKQRTSDLKTNKEYQAHLKEIEKIEKNLGSAEDNLLIIMQSLEDSSKLIKSEEINIAREKAKIETMKQELGKEAASCEADLMKLKDSRKQLVEKIDADAYDYYVSSLRAGRGVGVVEARDEICHGCNIHIPPQLFVEIKANNELMECPQCRRILYYIKPDDQV